VGGEIFRTRPDLPWGPPNLYKMRTGCLSGGVLKWPQYGVYHPPPSRAEVKERIELYLYSNSGFFVAVVGLALRLSVCRLIEAAG